MNYDYDYCYLITGTSIVLLHQCCTAAHLHCCFSSLSKRKFVNRVGEIKDAQQLMFNVHKPSACLAFPAPLKTAVPL